MSKKNHASTDPIDLNRLAIDIQSPDDRIRAKAVGFLCPCRIGMEQFQENLSLITSFQKDPSPAVRAAALHIFEDAGEMQNKGYPTNLREVTNEMLRNRRASRFLPEALEDESRSRKRKRRGHRK